MSPSTMETGTKSQKPLPVINNLKRHIAMENELLKKEVDMLKEFVTYLQNTNKRVKKND